MKLWKDIKATKMSPERQEHLDGEVRHELIAMQLRELREAAGRTQAEMAADAEMTQAELSRFERREDHLVSSLRRYVHALGGEVEVVAVIGNKRIALTGV